jgi:hypothetical protein
MKKWSPLAIAIILFAGCTHTQLQRSSLAQQSTLVDLQFQEVLDNVARFVVNPTTLPYFAYVGDGSTQVTTSGTTSVNLTWNPYMIASEALGLEGGRTVVETWNLKAISAPDRLRYMRYAYQAVVGYDAATSQQQVKNFIDTYQKGHPDEVPTGWFGWGCKQDVPKCVCYVTHCCDRYVWVEPGGMDRFSQFTMLILDIATISSEAGPPKLGATRDGGAPAILQPREPTSYPPGPQFYPQR